MFFNKCDNGTIPEILMLKKKIFWIDVFWVFCIFLLAYKSYGFRYNTPKNNGKWDSPEISLAKSVNGSVSFFEGTQAFAHNTLHLDAWYGFKELVTKDTFTPNEINFKFILKDGAYIYAEFNRNGQLFSAFRLSCSSDFPNASVLVNNGKFVTKNNYDAKFVPNRWYKATIKFDQNTNIASLFIDGKQVASIDFLYSHSGSIGFKSGIKPTSITHISVKNIEGKMIFRENFGFRDDHMMMRFLIGTVYLFLVWNFLRLVNNKFIHLRPATLIIFQLLVLFILFSIFCVNLYLVDKYPKEGKLLSYYWPTNTTMTNEEFLDLEIDEINKTLLSIPPKKDYRVLFIGSSQTWGAGADLEKNTFVSQIQEMVNSRFLGFNNNQENVLGIASPGADLRHLPSIEFINSGIPALYSTKAFDQYEKVWKHKLDPDMVIINLSSNDRDNQEHFNSDLRQFISSNKDDIKIVLVLEANSIEATDNAGLFLNHNIVRQIGKEYNIPVIDLQGYLVNQKDTGILWWDFVHMTSYGQSLAAKYLLDNISAFIVHLQ